MIQADYLTLVELFVGSSQVILNDETRRGKYGR
jgi:hypothetical protein